MELLHRCQCGHLIAYPFNDFGCLECGEPCCPLCSVVVESVTYCASCANALFTSTPAPRRAPTGATMEVER